MRGTNSTVSLCAAAGCQLWQVLSVWQTLMNLMVDEASCMFNKELTFHKTRILLVFL